MILACHARTVPTIFGMIYAWHARIIPNLVLKYRPSLPITIIGGDTKGNLSPGTVLACHARFMPTKIGMILAYHAILMPMLALARLLHAGKDRASPKMVQKCP